MIKLFYSNFANRGISVCVTFVRNPSGLYISRALGVCGMATTVAILAQGTILGFCCISAERFGCGCVVVPRKIKRSLWLFLLCQGCCIGLALHNMRQGRGQLTSSISISSSTRTSTT